MAIIENPLLQNASGSIGKIIVYKKYYDKTVVSKMPDMSKRVLSEKQRESNERMRLANIYAKQNYQNDEDKIKARIRLKVPAHKSAFHALVKEHLDKNRKTPLQELEVSFMQDISTR
jgi:hypothetical protein